MAPSFNVLKPLQPLVPCIVCDYTALNKSVKRPSTVTPDTETTLKKLPASATHFLSTDLTAGYWQLTLHEDSIPLTGFLTPENEPLEGTRLPMGLLSSGEAFNEKTDEVYRVGNVRNHCKLFDDVLLYGDSEESLAQIFQLFCEINRRNHLTMQPKKLQ